MKKNVFLALGLSLLIGFTSCNKVKEDPKKVEQEEKKANNLQHLTKAEFLTKVVNYEQTKEWKYLGDKPCIVDFYADWCGPCKKISPLLEELAKEYENEIYIYKINVDKERELASHFEIQSIPALLFISMNEEPKITVGGRSKEDIKADIETILLEKK